ncbi:prostate and testis expressed protein 14-like [Sphaerodactylus townsendi]|uniref:prostate and testis expressed protein 14-like n=1 Tax=Sphaerodactylus townsendi TaxID=933632 RepID=UPI0020267C2E|nr:prostate and testis expressed protein 14-like [Sphaerodactylus townsendi]
MTGILFFSLAALLCYTQTEALKCVVCKMLSGCVRKGGLTCEALPGQQCKATHVFKVRIRQFTLQGCTLPEDSHRCNTVKEDKMWGAVNTTCCNNKDLCNSIYED